MSDQMDPMSFEELEHEVGKLMDEYACRRVSSSYNLLHTAGKHQETADLFPPAELCSDSSMELTNWGLQVGKERINRMFVDFHNYMQGVGEARRGFHAEHDPLTPIFEVAEDRKTCRMMGHSIGAETYYYKDEVQPVFTWVKCGEDFINIDGKWYRWHGHAYDVFACAYKTGWGTPPADVLLEKSPVCLEKADLVNGALPTTYHLQFSPDYVAEYHPEAPEPYDTFDPDLSMA